MKSLYMYFIGGTIQGANIEVHDVQFAVADRPEDAFRKLASGWFGDEELLHVDVIRRINWVDGFDVVISPEPPTNGLSLYFVNMGGYLAEESFERHAFEVIVARNESEAKDAVKKRFFKDHLVPHRDFLMDVDGMLRLQHFDEGYIELVSNPNGQAELPSFQGYKQIGGNRFAYDETVDDLIHEETGSAWITNPYSAP